MNHSISSQILKTQRYFDSELLLEKRKVKVYIRTVNRKSIKIQLPSQILLSQLKQIIHKKFQIQDQNQVIYLKGTFLNHNSQIMLQNNWIIHAINLAEVNLSQIIIQIKSSTIPKKNNTLSKLSISPKITVKQFIQKFILNQYQVNHPQQILLVQSGRILNKNATFADLYIQNGTTLNLVHSQKDQSSNNSFNFSLSPSFIKTQSNIIENQDKKSQAQSVKTIQKNKVRHSNTIKERKNIYSQSQNYLSLKKVSSQKNLSNRDFSKTHKQIHECSKAKNLTTPIGQRQCNCKKQKPTETIIQVPKQTKIKVITAEDKKRLSKQIRQQNLQKLMRAKQKKQEQKTEQIKQQVKSPLTQRKRLSKVRSLQQLKPVLLTQRKPAGKIINPQKNIKL